MSVDGVIGSCHCGAVRYELPRAPETVTSCNCSVCRRTGALWAYDSPTRIRVTGATDTYVWGDRTLALHRCTTCGCITHWSPLAPGLDRMGVNARLLDPAVLAAARVRRIDGADTWQYLD